MNITVEALMLGLRFGMIALYGSIFLRVLINWKPMYCDAVPIDLVGSWWRMTWLFVALGILSLSVAHVTSFINPHPGISVLHDSLALFGLVLITLGGVTAKTGFNINRGTPASLFWMVLIMPVGFIVLSLWGLR